MTQAFSPDSGIDEHSRVDEIFHDLKKGAKKYEVNPPCSTGLNLSDVLDTIQQNSADGQNGLSKQDQEVPTLTHKQPTMSSPAASLSGLPEQKNTGKNAEGKPEEKLKRPRGRPKGSKNRPKSKEEKKTNILPNTMVNGTPTTLIIMTPNGANATQTAYVIPSTQASMRPILPKMTGSSGGSLILPKPTIATPISSTTSSIGMFKFFYFQ